MIVFSQQQSIIYNMLTNNKIMIKSFSIMLETQMLKIYYSKKN